MPLGARLAALAAIARFGLWLLAGLLGPAWWR